VRSTSSKNPGRFFSSFMSDDRSDFEPRGFPGTASKRRTRRSSPNPENIRHPWMNTVFSLLRHILDP